MRAPEAFTDRLGIRLPILLAPMAGACPPSHADEADRQMIGLMALLPQVIEAVAVPVIATGGIADGRGVAAALILGASAVQIGTGLLRAPEAKTHPAYADRLAHTHAHETIVTRAFSGRPGRSIATA
ncbi:MAG: nitronate monooxygenase [Bryobacteraceae bacterium]